MAATTTYKTRWTDKEGNVRTRSGRSPHPFKDEAELRAFLLKVNSSYTPSLEVIITGKEDVAVIGTDEEGRAILDPDVMLSRPSEFA